jgi:hypothetical protein
VVEAVDALGPVSDANTYDHVQWQPTVPGTMMYGMNKGPTADGRVTLNGQGDRLSNPQVLARSAPFVVQADPSRRALPSGPDADSVFYDTFDNHEGMSLHQTGASPPELDPPGGATKTYVLNDGDPQKGWTLHYQSASAMWAVPFIASDHFMDVNANQFTGSSWSTLAMQPQRVWDLAGDSILHATFEADSHMDMSGRRWLGMDFAPAATPFTSWVTGNLSVAPLNTSQQGLFVEIYSTVVRYRYFTGPSDQPGLPVEVNLGNCHSDRGQHYHYNGRGWDNRSRFDVFLTTTHVLVVEDGVLISHCALPVALPWLQTTAYFSHYMYHADAVPQEEPFWGPWNRYVIDRFPVTEERHWDNMGIERLPATAETHWPNPLGLLTRSQPLRPAAEQCPQDWQCAGVARVAPHYASGVEQRGEAAYAVHSGGVAGDDQDLLYGLWQPQAGDTTVQATLQDHANLSYWGVHGRAGVMLRASLDPQSPYLCLCRYQDGQLYLYDRTGVRAQSGVVVPLPVALRLTRTGGQVQAAYAADGTTWTNVGAPQPWNGDGLGGVVDWEQQGGGEGWFPQIGTAVFELAQTERPPQTPTATPTPLPLPTASPTATVTSVPTVPPTPTMAPSPTTGPTLAPTVTPTAVPTAAPPTATPPVPADACLVHVHQGSRVVATWPCE